MSFPILLLAATGICVLSCLSLATFRSLPAWLVAVVAGGGLLMIHVAYLHFYTSDDAFISFRYARNWAQTGAPVWNAGDRTDGYTNFLWTGLLAGSMKLGLPMPGTAFWGSFAASLGVLGATALLAGRWPERHPSGATRSLGLIVALLLAASGTFATWSYAGLEGPAFAFFVVMAAYLHIREEDDGGLPLSCLALLGAALTRPEGVLIFAITAVFKVYAWLRAGRPSNRIAWLFAWAALFLVPYSAYFAWHWSYYGYPFPNSFYAKVGSSWDQYKRGLNYVVNFGREYGALLALLVPVTLATRPDRRRHTLYLGVLFAVWTAYVTYVGGDLLVRYRLFVPVLPLFYLLASAGALDVLRLMQERSRAAWLWPAAVAGLVAVLAITLQPSSGAQDVRFEVRLQESREVIGTWLRTTVPDSYTIAVVAAGSVPYYSRLPAIDILGINDKHIAHLDIPLGKLWAGHEKFDTTYVLRRAPEIIALTSTLEPIQRCESADYTERFPNIAQSIPGAWELAHDPRLFQSYAPVSVELPTGGFFNMLVRTDIPAPWNACPSVSGA